MLKMLKTFLRGRKSNQEIIIKSYARVPIESGYEMIKSAQITPTRGDLDPFPLFSSILDEIASFAPTLSLETSSKELASNFTLFYSIQSKSEKDAVVALEVLQDRLRDVFESKGFHWKNHTSAMEDKVYSLLLEPPLSIMSSGNLLRVRTSNLRFYVAIFALPLSIEQIKQLMHNVKLLKADAVLTLRFRPLKLDNASYIGPITQFGELVMRQWETCSFISIRSLTKEKLMNIITSLEMDTSLTRISKPGLKQMLNRDFGPFCLTSTEHLSKLLASLVVENDKIPHMD